MHHGVRVSSGHLPDAISMYYTWLAITVVVVDKLHVTEMKVATELAVERRARYRGVPEPHPSPPSILCPTRCS